MKEEVHQENLREATVGAEKKLIRVMVTTNLQLVGMNISPHIHTLRMKLKQITTPHYVPKIGILPTPTRVGQKEMISREKLVLIPHDHRLKTF